MIKIVNRSFFSFNIMLETDQIGTPNIYNIIFI